MTEREWLACTDPEAMLEFLVGKASERKLRLFYVACCSRIMHLLTDQRSREAIEVAERFADGRATEDELEIAANEADDVWETDMTRASAEGKWDTKSNRPYYTPSAAAYNVAIPDGWWGAAPAFLTPDRIIRETTPNAVAVAAEQCIILRDIFVPLSFRPISLDSVWLPDAVKELATSIYEKKAFERTRALADALEEAGCNDADIISHCRSEGPHVRGCWALDWIFGLN